MHRQAAPSSIGTCTPHEVQSQASSRGRLPVVAVVPFTATSPPLTTPRGSCLRGPALAKPPCQEQEPRSLARTDTVTLTALFPRPTHHHQHHHHRHQSPTGSFPLLSPHRCPPCPARLIRHRSPWTISSEARKIGHPALRKPSLAILYSFMHPLVVIVNLLVHNEHQPSRHPFHPSGHGLCLLRWHASRRPLGGRCLTRGVPIRVAGC